MADIAGSKLTTLTTIAAGAGVIPAANLTSVAQKGANSDITSLSGLSTPISVAQGGTGSTAAANAASGVVVLDANSKIPVAQLGAWLSRATATDYLASTDGFVCAGGNVSDVNRIGYTDANASPATIVAQQYQAGAQSGSISFPVKKGNYWKVTSCNLFVWWIPLGS